MGNRLDWEKARPPRPEVEYSEVNRRHRTTGPQKARIRELHEALGRAGEPTIPRMSYDARLEIKRLEMVLETRQRMARG